MSAERSPFDTLVAGLVILVALAGLAMGFGFWARLIVLAWSFGYGALP